MSRRYAVTFRKGDDVRTFNGFGNVRTSAERSARHRLRDAVGGDTKGWYVISTVYDPEEPS